MAKIDIRRPRVWIPAILGLVFVAIVVFRVMEANAPAEPTPSVEEIREQSGIPVSVASVDAGELEVWLSFNGSVSGVRDAEIRARTGDQVEAVLVGVGDRVREGQVVVRQAGEGNQARVRQARVAAEQAARTVERLRPLYEAGAISDQEFDQAVTQAELAAADLAAARDVMALTSPLAGTVTEVTARPGMIPSPGDPLVRVADLSELVVRLQVSSREAARLDVGQRARLQGGTAAGEVRRVALQADPVTRLVEVEVAFPPGARLIPGTLATVEVEVASREDAVQVPASAVTDGGVWVVTEDDRVTRREVQVGLEAANVVEVTSGIEPGERVVVQGGSLLSEGARVRVVNARAVDDDV
ncbi:MAG TPA: efflux RND transporter periplasmic adaptor subunit [Longimicrobiales bacterium]|nr:efflux RND transporter periplasmic adaptor subunit [Longimicrobiales bacterium]